MIGADDSCRRFNASSGQLDGMTRLWPEIALRDATDALMLAIARLPQSQFTSDVFHGRPLGSALGPLGNDIEPLARPLAMLIRSSLAASPKHSQIAKSSAASGCRTSWIGPDCPLPLPLETHFFAIRQRLRLWRRVLWGVLAEKP